MSPPSQKPKQPSSYRSQNKMISISLQACDKTVTCFRSFVRSIEGDLAKSPL